MSWKFSVKMLIGLLLVFIQVGISLVMQSEAAPLVIPLIIALFYGGWCNSYILGFSISSLSFMAYFFAVATFYAIHQGISSFFIVLQPAFTALGFYFWVILFGLLGVISVKLGRWFRKKPTIETVEANSTT